MSWWLWVLIGLAIYLPCWRKTFQYMHKDLSAGENWGLLIATLFLTAMVTFMGLGAVLYLGAFISWLWNRSGLKGISAKRATDWLARERKFPRGRIGTK